MDQREIDRIPKDIESLPRLLIIAGPTASGKSRLAIELAKKLNGVVINADSMQVYQEMRIITARPSLEDESCVPHRLYGVLSVKERCSVGFWREMALREINKAYNEKTLPIVVGGTGLYIKVLLDGISEIPEVSSVIRTQVTSLFDQIGSKAFHARLNKIDPEAAKRIPIADTQRLTRAYEVYLATGISLTDWHKHAPISQTVEANARVLVMHPPRKELYAKCNLRFETMLANGALDEIRDLMMLKLDPSLPAMKALGVPELVSYLKGEISLVQATDMAKQATRNFAKRQLTWFRNQNGKVEHVFEQYSERLLEGMLTKIRF